MRNAARSFVYLLASSAVQLAVAQDVTHLAPEVRQYLRVSTSRVVLQHVQVIDGTGAGALPDRDVVIENGKIAAISAGADTTAREDTTILDLRGYSVVPGIVGMHGHLWYLARPNLKDNGDYEGSAQGMQMSFSAPRLYLANGVTTMRTAGSVAPQADLNLQQQIERGEVPGPHLEVTGPYLNGVGIASLRVGALKGPEDARQTVAFWAEHGVTSFKAYTSITRAELQAVVAEAHRRGLTVLGHLCSVTYEEAAEIGIDSLEHGFFVNTQLDPDKKPDQCSSSRGDYTLEHLSATQADQLIATLIQHHVAITSTLPNTASYASAFNQAADQQREAAVLAAMSPAARAGYLIDVRGDRSGARDSTDLLRRDMELERAFVARGGLLMAGSDPVGLRGLVPGFADHREIELLVEAGFHPIQAIRIATFNGAVFLKRQDRIGSIAVGKDADLLVVRGDPATRIADLRNLEIVFKDGAGYDPQKLLEAVKGRYGEY